MDRRVAARVKPTHLVCRTGWALALALVCAYFAYRAYATIGTSDYEWRHGWWDVLTWAVWALLAAGVVSEVRCWRERLLFGVLFVQFVIGCIFSSWGSAPFDFVREARQASLILWCFAVLLSVVALVSRRSSDAPAS
jgi:hypothetical protein